MTPVVEYIKNVGKSFVYTTVEQLGVDMPATKEFMESNEELFKDTYHSIMNIRRTKNRFFNAIKKTAVYDTVDYAFDNIVDSFKTGKFNDPYRQAKADQEAMGLDDFESGDSDMSMSNFGDSTSTGGSMDENTKAVIDSSANNAKSITTATLESAKYVAGVSKANTALLFNQTLKMNQTLSAGFSGLNAGMDALNKFNTEVVQTLAENATNYFQKTTDLMQENNAMFKEFLEMQRNLYKKSNNEEFKEHDLYNILGSSGTPNLKLYGKMIFDNIKKELEEIPIVGNILEQPEVLKSFLANPLSAIPGIMMSAAMGPMLKTSLQKMDETISGIFGSIVAKFSFDAKNEDAPWYRQLFGKIFGVRDLNKSTINTTNTKNGPTPFDLQTKRAITEVIPGYLARIESGITGMPAKLYNDKTGKWTDIKTLRENFNRSAEYAKTSGSSELHSEMRKNMTDAKWNPYLIDAMEKVMDKIAKKRYRDDGHLELFKGDINKFADYYGLGYNEAKTYMNLFGSTSRKARINSSTNILQSKMQQRNSLKYEESLGSQSLLRQLFTEGFDDIPNTRAFIYDKDKNGNIKRDKLGNPQMQYNTAENVGGVFNLNNMSDKYGATVFDYLRSIDINTSRINGQGGGSDTPSNNHPTPISSGAILANDGILSFPDTYNSGIIIPGRKEYYDTNNTTESGIIIARRTDSPTKLSSSTNKDSIEDKIVPESENSIKMSDIQSEKLHKMLFDINRVGTVNMLKELQVKYEENDPKVASNIAELLDNLDELAHFNTKTRPGDQYEGKWGKELITNNEDLQNLLKQLQIPAAAMSGIVDSFNDAVYNFLYGDLDEMFKDSHNKVTEILTDGEVKEKPKGFFNAMAYGMNNMFERVKKNIDNLDEEKKNSIWSKADAMMSGIFGFQMKEILKESKRIALQQIGSPILDTIKGLSGFGSGKTEVIKNTIEGNLKAMMGGNDQSSELDDDRKQKIINRIESGKKSINAIAHEEGIPLGELQRMYNSHVESKNNSNLEYAAGLVKEGYNIAYAAETTGISVQDLDKYIKSNIPKDENATEEENKPQEAPTKLPNTFMPDYTSTANIVKKNTTISNVPQMKSSFNKNDIDDKREKYLINRINEGNKPINVIAYEEGIPVGALQRLYNDSKNKDSAIKFAAQLVQEGENIGAVAQQYGLSTKDIENYMNQSSIENIPGHADGATKVTKSGLTFLSKGEIVIPNASEEQRKLDGINEEKIRQKFINQAKNAQMFSDGGQAKNDNDDSELTFGDFVKGLKGVAKGLLAKFSEESEDNDSIGGRIEEILFGDSFKETKETVKKVEDEIKGKVPNIAAGGLLGTAGGALIGGPLVGAVLGSALGIASNSETVQTALFGEKLVDENGNETGERNGSGLFSRQAQETMKKYIPDMKKFGITGAVMGMFTPFGLLGGALMGSAIGFIKNNESAQEALFGKDGLIPEDAQQKLKKYFPSAAKGGAAGMFLGLAGGLGGIPLLGVAALGAGIGLVTTTDEFKDEVLGKMGKDGKRHGGVLEEFKKETVGPFKKFGKDMTDGFKEWFKEDIAAPVVKSMKPMGKQMSMMAKSTIGFGKKLIKGIMNGNTGIPIIDNIMGSNAGRFTRWAGRNLGGGVKWLAKGVLSAPSKAIGKFGDKLRERQIKMGNADYMTADERMEFMSNRGDYAGRETDEMLSKMGVDDLKRQSEMISAIKNGPEQFDENITNTRKNLFKGLSQSLDARKNNTAVKELKRLIDKNDLEGAQKYLASLDIPKNKKAELSKMIQNAYTNIKENEYKRDNYNETKEGLLKEFSKEYGQNIDMTNIDKLESIVNNEYKNRTKEDEENKESSEEDKLADVIAGKGDEQISELQDVNTRLEKLVGLFTVFTESIGLTDKQQAELDKQANAGKAVMDKLTGDAAKANKQRQTEMSKLFGDKGLNRDTRNKIKRDDTGEFTNQLKRFHKTGSGEIIDPNYFSSLDSDTRNLYLTLSEQGYVIENIDVISNLSSTKKEKLLKLTSAGFKVQSIQEITKLSNKTLDTLVFMMQFNAMKKLPQKSLIDFANKYGKRFMNDDAFRKESLINAAEKGKNFDGKLVEDNLRRFDSSKLQEQSENNKDSKSDSSTQEEKEAESQQPEDVEKHSLGGLIKSAGAAIVSKGETILKAGSQAAKNWAKNKIKEKWENSAAGRVYKKASNLKATVSNAIEANGENNGMDMTKGSDGRSIAANTKENADIKKAEQQKNAMQQDNNDSLHQLVAINEQIATNTMPAEEKPGGGLLGGLLTLLGSFLLDKVPKAWKFLKDKVKFLKDIFNGIRDIGPKIAEIAPKIVKGIEDLGPKIVKSIEGIGTKISEGFKGIKDFINEGKEVVTETKEGTSIFSRIKDFFKGSKDVITGAKEGTGILGKIGGLLGLGKTATDAVKDGAEGKTALQSAINMVNQGYNLNYVAQANGIPAKELEKAVELAKEGGELAKGGTQAATGLLSRFANLPGAKTIGGIGSKVMKGLNFYNFADKSMSLYDFATADSMEDRGKMLSDWWNNNAWWQKGLDAWMTYDAAKYGKNMLTGAKNFITGGGEAAEGAAKGSGLLSKGIDKAKDIGKNIKGVFDHVGGFDTLKKMGGEMGSKIMDKAGGMAENMKTIIAKVTELIDKAISKVSSLVTEKFGKAMLKMKDIIIKTLSNPNTYKKILKAGGKALAKLGLAATGVGAIVTAGWMAADAALAFYDGFNDATNLLGLSGNYDPTIDVKMLAGSINAIFDASIVGPIIWEPREFFDLCLTEVGPIVGITKDQLEEDCKKADENPPSIIDNALNVAKYTGPLGYAVSKGGKWLKDKITESDTYKAAKEFVGEKANQFYEGVEELGGKAKETLNNGIEIAYQFYEGMKEKASEVIDSFTTSITEGINNLTDFIGKSWTNLKDGIAKGISSVVTNLGKLGTSILDGIKNSAIGQSAGRLWNNAKNTYNNAKNWVIDKWTSTQDLWNKAKESVKNSSLGRRIWNSGSGKWGTGSNTADIDTISSYEDCMELLAGIKIDSLPAQDRPSSKDDIPTLKKKARAILSKFGKGKWGRGNKETDAWNIFHSQLDPTNSMGFNASGDTMEQSMADSGCGPVSAANIGSYFGKHIDSKDAASYALKNGYKEKNGGTKDGFFGDFLGKYGIGTKHITPGSAKDSLRKGKPVILMGKDKSNNPILDATGKSKTPFGSNPHYVVATGLGKDGSMIIQDPESRTPNKKYKASDVMNKSSIAMEASTGMGRWGRGPTVDEDPPFGSVAASIAKQAGSEHPELFWAQMMVETGGPEKAKADTAKYGEDYNYGGFTWYPSMGEDHKGVPRPEGGYYAKFSSDAEYAEAAYNKIFKHYPDSIKTVATPEEFAHLLKEQGYYSSDEASYADGLKAHLNGPYKDKLKNLGGMAGNISSSGSSGGPSGGKKKYGGLFGAFDRLSDVFGAILNGEDDDGSASPSGGANSPGGALANGGVPANTGLDYMLKNMPGAEVTSNYKDESGRPTPGEHGGIDIAADENTPVPTPVGGTVEDAGTEEGYGNYVQVKDKNGNYHLFGHLNQHKVKTGDSVTRGSIVGLEGSTGHSTGPHVHYQIDPPDNVNALKSGSHLDPSTYSLSGLGKWGLGRLKAKFGKGKWGTGNGAAIWDYLKSKGLGSSTIAGIMGNMQAESSLEPTIVEGGGHADEITVDGSTGYGLCQWTNQGRQQGLKDFAASRGTKSGDLNTQLDYMLKEISDGHGDLLQRMDGMSPYDAALLFHKEFEGSDDTEDMAKRRGNYANQIAQSEGKGESFNGSYSGSSGSSGKKHKGLFGAFDAITDVFSAILNGDDSNDNSSGSSNGGVVAGGHSSDAGIQSATAWANSMTGQEGFGNNGCTEFVKQYLQKAGNPVGQYMADGSQGNLMWVPTLEEWAKSHNMFKPASAGGVEGDVAICNDHGHVIIADGDGGYWGNSSSKNQIVHSSSIANDFNTPDGYISTGSSGKSTVSQGKATRSTDEMLADGGTTNGWGGSKWGRGGILDFISNAQGSWESLKKSGEQIASLWNPHLREKNKTQTTSGLLSKIESAKPKTPIEFRKITDEDIEKIGTASEAIALLRAGSIPLDKIPDMNMPKDSDSTNVIRSKLKKIVATIKPERAADVDENGLVDGKYEKNDVDYLLNNGYTKEAAIELLSKDPKYTEKKTDLEKKMDNNSFDLDKVKKNFQDRVNQLFNGGNSTTQQTTSSTQTKSSANTTAAQATPAAAQIDYTEKFDTMINLLSTLVQVFTNGATANANGTGVTTSNASAVHMINNKNIGAVRNEDLAKLFTNINNSMNALASR